MGRLKKNAAADPGRRNPARRGDLKLVLGVVAFAALLRVVFLIYMPNVFSQEGESYSRINLMLTWLAQGGSYPDTNFGPMHTWFVYAVTLPFDNYVWPVRISHAILGVLTVIPFFYMVRSVYGSSVAAWSGLYLGAFHVHLRATVTGLAEGPFIFCLITGIAFAVIALTRRKPPLAYLVLSALFMNLAGSFRFEAWLYLPLICIFMLWRSPAKAVLYGAMNLVFPLVHMGMCYRFAPEPKTLLDGLSFARTSGTSFLQYMIHLPLSYKLLAWPRAFWISLTPPMSVLCAIGLLWGLGRAGGGVRQRSRQVLLGVLPLLFLFNIGIFFYRAVKGTIDPAIYRYTLSMDLMLIPPAVWAVHEVFGRIGMSRRMRGGAAAVVMIACIAWTLTAAVQETRANAYPDDIVAVVQWVKQNADPKDLIVPDHDYHPYLLVESGLPQKAFESLRWTGPLRNEPDMEWYEELFGQHKPTLMILDHDCNPDIGGNCILFEFTKDGGDAFEQDGRRFTRVMQSGDYSIFRIEHLQQDAAQSEPEHEQPAP